MTTPNAQAQARWRIKRNAEIQALRNIPPNLGPDILLAPVEVSYLLPLLMAYRYKPTERPHQEAEPLREAEKVAPDPDALRKKHEAAERRLLAKQHREQLREPDGDYFVVWVTQISFSPKVSRYSVAQINLITKGKYQQATREGYKVDIEFNAKRDIWEIYGSRLHPTWDSAAESGQQRAQPGDVVFGLIPELVTADKATLRRIRARNHPDHNADGNTALYQHAIQALDALRNG
jgi:hypothetical protein